MQALAEDTVTGLPAQTVAELPAILKTMTGNIDTRRPATHTAESTLRLPIEQVWRLRYPGSIWSGRQVPLRLAIDIRPVSARCQTPS
jgi:hypothetical protein